MFQPTLDEYLQLLKNTPNLCVHGMANDVQKNFEANRKSLEASYDAFLLCWAWFSQQKSSELVELSLRSSIELKHAIESSYGRFIPHGTVLAAAIFHGIALSMDIGPAAAVAND
ncbi:MAG: hypothetical protein JXK94_03145 [Deltaproteobacteria bacterium]|nr:hypothetical protein [Deltaproteobacteria bacterium]